MAKKENPEPIQQKDEYLGKEQDTKLKTPKEIKQGMIRYLVPWLEDETGTPEKNTDGTFRVYLPRERRRSWFDQQHPYANKTIETVNCSDRNTICLKAKIEIFVDVDGQNIPRVAEALFFRTATDTDTASSNGRKAQDCAFDEAMKHLGFFLPEEYSGIRVLPDPNIKPTKDNAPDGVDLDPKPTPAAEIPKLDDDAKMSELANKQKQK